MRRPLSSLLLATALATPAMAASIGFDPPIPTPVFGVQGERPLAVGDVDRDGRPDVAVAATSRVQVLVGDGHGRFLVRSNFLISNPRLVALAQLRPGAPLDLVVVTSAGSLVVVRGRGDGNFDPFPSFTRALGSPAADLVAGDLDGDGADEVIVSHGGRISIFINNGLGTVVNETGTTGPLVPRLLALGALDDAGFPDLATGDTGGVSVYTGTGTGFGGGVPVDTSGSPTAIALADIDGLIDTAGRLDLLVATDRGSLGVLRNGAGGVGGSFDLMSEVFSFGEPIAELLGGDVDGDGGGDVVAVLASGMLYGLHGNGDASFRQDVKRPAVPGVTGSALADLDGDGMPDLVLVSQAGIATMRNTSAAGSAPPVAQDDRLATGEDTAVSADLVANDHDDDTPQPELRIVPGSLSAPAHGTVTLEADGRTVTYLPATDFAGSDGFSYLVTDGTSMSATRGQVSIDVAPVNDAPVARADDVHATEDTQLLVEPLGNDSDVDTAHGDLQAILVSLPAHGVVKVLDGRSFRYTPEADFNGTDSFTYQTSDGLLTSDVVAVTIAVAAANDPPVNTALPAVSIASARPLTLRSSTGAWNDTTDGGTSITYAYQWQRASAPGGAVSDIAGARAATYVTGAADVGKYLRVVVTATDSGVPGNASSQAASEWFASAVPANDDIGKAIVLAAGPGGTVTGTNVVATRQTGEPDHARHAAGHSVWWQWKAPKQGGTLTVDTAGSGFDTVLAIYAGTKIATLAHQGSNDDDGTSAQSRVSIPVVPGTVYSIAVDGAASTTRPTTGPVILNWSFAPGGPG